MQRILRILSLNGKLESFAERRPFFPFDSRTMPSCTRRDPLQIQLIKLTPFTFHSVYMYSLGRVYQPRSARYLAQQSESDFQSGSVYGKYRAYYFSRLTLRLNYLRSIVYLKLVRTYLYAFERRRKPDGG